MQELTLIFDMERRSVSEFSEICNGKLLFVIKYKVVFSMTLCYYHVTDAF